MVSVVFTAFRNLNLESLHRLAKPLPSIGNKNCFGKGLHCSFAYSALASLRMGMSGSASFQRVRKSL
jgi:hypothetical protein